MAILYSDESIISKNDYGFTLNFCTGKIPGISEDPTVVTQIGISPQFAKCFLIHLYSQIGKFEDEFGEIQVPEPKITELKSIKKRPIGF